MTTKVIALTGAQGFIGQQVVRQWQQDAAAHALGTLIPWQGDILDDKARDLFFTRHQPDIIIHLAGRSYGQLDQIFDKNVLAVQQLLNSATKHGVKHVVFSSSAAVYGNTGVIPVKENFPTHPANEYGLSKLLAEKIIEYHQDFGELTAVVLRFANVYGASSRKGVVADMINSIQKSGKIMIDGDGYQLRSFVHVSDAVQAIIAASKLHENHILNVGTTVHSIQEIAELVKAKYGGEIVYKEKVSDLKEMVVDSRNATKILSFSPQHPQIFLGE